MLYWHECAGLFATSKKHKKLWSASHKQNFMFSKPLIWKFTTLTTSAWLIYLELFHGDTDISLGHDELLTFAFLWFFFFLDREQRSFLWACLPQAATIHSGSLVTFCYSNRNLSVLYNCNNTRPTWQNGTEPFNPAWLRQRLWKRQVERRILAAY